MAVKKAYWNFFTGDMCAYVKCSHCGRKVSAKEFVMANSNWLECPGCSAAMDLSRLDYDLLVQEASNER